MYVSLIKTFQIQQALHQRFNRWGDISFQQEMSYLRGKKRGVGSFPKLVWIPTMQGKQNITIFYVRVMMTQQL